MGCRACRDIREETQRGGSKEGAQGRGGKKTGVVPATVTINLFNA